MGKEFYRATRLICSAQHVQIARPCSKLSRLMMVKIDGRASSLPQRTEDVLVASRETQRHKSSDDRGLTL